MQKHIRHNTGSDLQEYELCKGANEEAKKSCYNKSMTDEFQMLRKSLSDKAKIFMTTNNNIKTEVLHNAMEKKRQLRHEIPMELQKKNTRQQKGGEVW